MGAAELGEGRQEKGFIWVLGAEEITGLDGRGWLALREEADATHIVCSPSRKVTCFLFVRYFL
jgi:hypothetical protein